MTTLLITSDRPGVGKTATAAAIVSEVLDGGGKAAYLKLFPTRADPDVSYLHEHVLGGEEASAPAQSPGSSSSGDMGLEDTLVLAQQLSAGGHVVVLEGPALIPDEGNPAARVEEIVRKLDCRVLYVKGYSNSEPSRSGQPGGLAFGKHLAGVILNMVPPYRLSQLSGDIVTEGLLGAIPSDRTMASVTVGEVARRLNGTWVVGEEKAGALIENFLIGGNIMDGGETYFGRHENKGVLVRGDRPDIHLACLNTETACLLLTGGFTPNQYVHHEAEQQDVPLLVMEKDTIACAELLDELLLVPPVHHPDKTHRFRELLRSHVDLGFLSELLEGIA